MTKGKMFYIIPLFFSMGCIASGIGFDANSLVYTGGFFLFLSTTPYVYLPLKKKREKLKAIQKFQGWYGLSELTGLSYFMPEKEPFFPSISGEYRGYKVSILPYLEKLGNTKLLRQFTMIKIPIQNKAKLRIFIKDKEMLDSMFSFFVPSIHGASNDSRIEKRFIIKSNPERLAHLVLKDNEIVENLLKIGTFRLELLEDCFILTLDGVQKDVNTQKENLDLAIDFINHFYAISQRYYPNYKAA